MNKQIVFSLLITISTTLHGMEISTNDISTEKALISFYESTPLITKYLCNSYRSEPAKVKNDIRSLYLTNKFFHEHYSQKKVMQSIIDIGARIYYSNSHMHVTTVLGCHTIMQKMKHLLTIANNKEMQFTEIDLQDPWYFGITLEPDYQSLVYRLIHNLDFTKAHAVIDHAKKIDFGWHKDNYLLRLIAQGRYNLKCKLAEQNILDELLIITERLLKEKKMPADGTFLPLTALMYAAQHDDKELAHLLLRYGANPDKKRGSWFSGKNSFEYETGEPQGWLETMVDEIEAAKNKREK